jgi:ribosomal protein S19
MTRARWKGPFIANIMLPQDPKAPIYTAARACTIIPDFVGRTFHVHNGKSYLPVQIQESMLGHKLGEFALTRKPFKYKKKDEKR